jgi:hypothetical protein
MKLLSVAARPLLFAFFCLVHMRAQENGGVDDYIRHEMAVRSVPGLAFAVHRERPDCPGRRIRFGSVEREDLVLGLSPVR